MASSGLQVPMDNRVESASQTDATARIRPLVLFAAWTTPALLSSFQQWATRSLSGQSASFASIAATEFPGWLLWAVMTPLIFRVAHRFPLRRPVRVRDISAHAATWTLCLALHAIIVSRDFSTNGASNSYARYVGLSAIAWLPSTFLLYVVTVGAALWMAANVRAQQRERERAAMSVELARAELSALRSQLHPHFLFNTLNTIAILIRERDTHASARLVTQLGDVLRRVLQGTRANLTSLEEEIALVSTYLEIEQARFGDRLEVQWSIDSELLSAEVPSLVLQPLVENALRHAVAHRIASGVVEVGATLGKVKRDSDSANTLELVLWISDNGADVRTYPAFDQAARLVGGVGLQNTRERLSLLYPSRSSLELTATVDGGSRAEVRMPYRKWNAA